MYQSKNELLNAAQSNKNRIVRRVVAGSMLVGAAVVNAHAATGDFDPTAAIAILAATMVGVAAIVGSIIAVSGGLDVYQKVRGFFKRAR